MNRFLGNPTAVFLILIMAYQALKSGGFNNPSEWLLSTVMILPGIIIGLSFHEFAHAITANLLGDPTPKRQGRVTVNPLAHIDPVGFIALIFIRFGWGKPVMINPNNFGKPRRDEFFVAIAGVFMNLILAVLFMGIIRILYEFQPVFMFSEMGMIISNIFEQVVIINIVLMVFNLLPIPPLDGFNIITQVFNLRNTSFYYQLYDKGFFILMALILFNITGRILSPAISYVYNTLVVIFFY